MSIRERLSGNEAVAIAMKQINPDVVAAFPITPSTEIPQYFSQYVSNGEVETAFVPVESEHSARSKNNDCYIFLWSCINLGNAICGSF